MNGQPDEVQDLIASVALGIATEDERARLEALAVSDPSVARELDAARASVDVMAQDVPPVDPPARLRARLMNDVRSTTRRPRRARSRSVDGFRWWDVTRAWPAVAAVLAVVTVALLGWNLSLRSDGGPVVSGITDVAVTATESAPDARGRVVLVQNGGVALLTLEGMPAAGPGEGHELWVLRGGAPASAGFLQRRPDGSLVGVATSLDGVDQLAVTIEPRTNTTAPTGQLLVVADI